MRVPNRESLRKRLNGSTLFALLSLWLTTAITQNATGTPINLVQTAVPLKVVLDTIASQAEVNFSYNPRKIPLNTRIDCNFQNASLTDVMQGITYGLPIRYELMEGYIILKKGPVQFAPQEKRKVSLHGYVKDEESGEILIGATLYIKELGIGAITNKYGYFSITIPPGRYTISFSYIGYEARSQMVELSGDMNFDFTLPPSLERLEEVLVFTDEEEMELKKVSSQSEVVPEKIKTQPALFGEADVLKSLELQAGIHYYGDGSSNFHVRGGHYDQNLILLDEATLYNPSHLLGLFTPIAPDAVKTADVYKAGFPVQYGGRLSSVIDIRTKDGNKEQVSGLVNLGLIAARASLEGPIRKGRSSYFITLRRSYFDKFLQAALPEFGDLYFYDFTAKLNLRLGSKDRLFFTQYKGQDVFRTPEGNGEWTGIDWGNVSTTLRWNHVFGTQAFLNTSLLTSNYDYYLRGDLRKDIYWNSRIINTALKQELTLFTTPEFNWRVGYKMSFYDFNPGNYNAPDLTEDYQVSPVNSLEFILYSGAEYQFSSRMIFNYGLRLTSWSNYGEGFVVDYNRQYQAQDITYYGAGERSYKHRSLQPRLLLSYKLAKRSYLKSSYSRTVQHINQISNTVSPFNSFEVWLPSGSNIKPQYADILDLGLLRSTKNGLHMQTGVFTKKMQNQIGYSYHANMLVNPLLEGELRQGDGRAYGGEFTLQLEKEKLFLQVAYTYTRSFLDIKELNGGRIFPATHDRPHCLNLSTALQARPRWLLTGTLNWSSGSRISTPTSFYTYQGYQVPVFTEQNNDQLPPYRRFDIASTFTLNKRKRSFEHQLTLAVYNFFAHKNPIFLYYNKADINDAMLVPSDRMNPRELTPSIRYTFVFMPSISYQFTF